MLNWIFVTKSGRIASVWSHLTIAQDLKSYTLSAEPTMKREIKRSRRISLSLSRRLICIYGLTGVWQNTTREGETTAEKNGILLSI